jgi:uncharacterized membrane protein
MKTFRIDIFAWIIFSLVSLIPMFLCVALWTERHYILGFLCGCGSFVLFPLLCFQKLVFEDDLMTYSSLRFGKQTISLKNISKVHIAMIVKDRSPQWQCAITGGGKVLLKFCPKPFSLSAIDFLIERVRYYSPDAIIENGIHAFRTKKP